MLLKPVDVFFAYSLRDALLRDELVTHLAMLRRQGLIREWHAGQIGAGKNWREEIQQHLQAAHIILLLISADFLAEDFCFTVEVARAVERHERGEARVIPVILRACEWSVPFANLRALPQNAKPVTSWLDRDEAWLSVAHGIRHAVGSLHEPAPPSGPTEAHESHRPRIASLEIHPSHPRLGEPVRVRVTARAGNTTARKLYLNLSFPTPVANDMIRVVGPDGGCLISGRGEVTWGDYGRCNNLVLNYPRAERYVDELPPREELVLHVEVDPIRTGPFHVYTRVTAHDAVVGDYDGDPSRELGAATLDQQLEYVYARRVLVGDPLPHAQSELLLTRRL